MRLILGLGALALLGLSFAECKSEFCVYGNLFNSTSNATAPKPKPLPVFKIPPPPSKPSAESPIKALKTVEVVSSSSAAVEVSLTDVNRIVCPSSLKGFVYSKEKLVKIERSGSSLYVKFLPVKRWNSKEGRVEYYYPDFPRDLFVECGDKTFALVLLPKRGLPPKEVYLKLPYGNKKRASEFESSFPYEETLMRLIKYAYKDEVPPGYTVRFVGKPYREFKELSLYLNKVYEGDGFKVEEFIITAKSDLKLEEGMFVPFFPDALAIAIEKPLLKRGDVTRLFVVERLSD